MLLRLLAALLLWFSVAQAGAATPAVDEPLALPALKARVTDLTATLSAEQVQSLEARLAAFEAGKGSQIAVLLLPSTQPETIEEFAVRLQEAWKIGRKGVDDGVLMIIAKDDRSLRIEVGYGLEGALNDATAKRIVSEVMTPLLKAGDFFAAIQAGVEAIIGVVSGEPLPAPAGPSTKASGGWLAGLGENALLFLIGAVAVGGAILRHFLGDLLGSLVAGGVTGAVGWFVGGVFGAVFGGIVGFLLALFGLELLLRFGSGGGGRGGGGGGGFGGGGGLSGGGGASGRW